MGTVGTTGTDVAKIRIGKRKIRFIKNIKNGYKVSTYWERG